MTRSSLVAELVDESLGGRVLCDLDQCWLRRQYAPSRYPPAHKPHSWHQDGALGFNFGATPADGSAENGLIPMVTLWIALTSCGQDAPGLETLPVRPPRLLKLSELQREVSRRTTGGAGVWAPVLEAGDALLLEASTLHRTYVMPHMRQDRTSIEVRFFPMPDPPERLSQDRFIAVALG